MSTPVPQLFHAYYIPAWGPLIWKSFDTQQGVTDQIATWIGWHQGAGPQPGDLVWTDGTLGPSTSPASPASSTTQETTTTSTSSTAPT